MRSRFVWFIKVFFPVLYIPFCIVLPVYGMNTDYGWSVVIGFWVPIVLLACIVLPGETPAMIVSFIITSLIFMAITVPFEFFGLALDIWNFDETKSSLWGLSFMGVPIEEFVFWFGATPLCMLLYLYYRNIFKKGAP